MRRKIILIASIIFLGAPLRAAEIEKVRFADSVRAGGAALPLHGVGLLRYKKFIKAYVAALYLDSSVNSRDVLSDVAKRLEIEYFWKISGPDFGKTANQIMARTHPADELSPIRPRIDQLHALYRDVKPGDRYALTYLPGVGTELALNGKPIVTIPGADFASVYFAIWLGEKSGSDSLRVQLLSPIKLSKR